MKRRKILLAKVLTLVLTVAMVLSISIPTFAYYDAYGNWYPDNTYNYGMYSNGYNNGYYGENYYNTNYNGYNSNYYMSDWASDLRDAYDPTWYEVPQRQVTRGEAFLLWLRAVQKSLDRQRYARLMAGYGSVPFLDYNSVNPYAQSEVNVLYSNGILVGYEDNTMRFSQLLSRAEMAAIYSRFNRIYFNMGVGYSQYNYDGYYNYYNNNYNNYYNNYMFADIAGHWAQQDIVTAASNGVLRGVGNNYFDTEGPLTIEQVWKMLDCCVGYQGLKRSDIAYGMAQTFKVKFGKNIDESYNSPTGIKITRLTASTTVSINEGQTKTVKVTIYPSNAGYQKLNWISADTRYVSVEESWNSSNGTANVTLYGRIPTNGYITVTGRALDGSGASVSIKVKVNSNYEYEDYDDGYISSITASESTIYMKPGESKQINARIKPTDAYNKNLSWTSSDSSIAYPSNIYTSGSYSYATIKAVRTGTAYLYINALDGSGEQEVVNVIVQDGTIPTSSIVTSVTPNPNSLFMNIGENRNVTFSVYPSNATDRNISWISDNVNVARVGTTTGSYIEVIAVGVGNTYIIGKNSAGNIVCQIPVTVSAGVNPGTTDITPPVVSLEGATSVNIGETITITARVSDNVAVSSFNIGVNSILGMTGSMSVNKIEKISNTEYRITLMGVEVASQCICIAGEAAVDSSGNVSAESNEIVIFVNSGE